MKINIFKKIALSAIGVLLLSSCVDTDINMDPNSSGNMDPNMQITNVQQSFTNYQDDYWRYFVYPGGFINHWSGDWSTVNYGGVGKRSNTHMARLWEVLYPGIIVNTVDIIERTKDDASMANVNAAARVIKVQNFLRLTDYYGDIPYFDAGKAYFGGSFTPAYDTQKDIYHDMLKELKEASAQFTSEVPTLSADLYYAGDLDKWKRFTNSLRLRIALRLVKVDEALAKTEVEDAVTAGVMTSNADICYIQHDDVLSTEKSAGNAIANLIFKGNQTGTFRLTNDLIGAMEQRKDPRILFYGGAFLNDGGNDARTDITQQVKDHYGSYKAFGIFSQEYTWSTLTGNAVAGEIEVMVNGKPVKVARNYQLMQPSRYISYPKSPFIHMSYAEVEFLLADAALRGYNVGGTAAAHYKAGLEASVNQWILFGAAPNADAITEFTRLNVLPSAKEAGLKEVNTQLWILHFLDPLEAWSNIRRSGEPAEETQFYNRVPAENQSDGQAPRRMEYPVAEQTNNPTEYKIAVDRIEGTVEGGTKDHWLNRVWWDVKK